MTATYMPVQYVYTHSEVTGAREILSVFMKRYSHNSVCRVECLLHTISVMDIYVYVQNSLVVPTDTRHAQNQVAGANKPHWVTSYLPTSLSNYWGFHMIQTTLDKFYGLQVIWLITSTMVAFYQLNILQYRLILPRSSVMIHCYLDSDNGGGALA